MFTSKKIFNALAAIAAVTLIASCSEVETTKSEVVVAQSSAIVLDVHKSPTCGCCKTWITHLDNHAFQSNVVDSNDITLIKKQKGIEPRYRSCHTAISKAGYVFEGHIPAKYIQQFLTETHADNVLGLAVPAMPVGSPGMEVGDKFQPYKILRLMSDGSYDIYAVVQSYKEQF